MGTKKKKSKGKNSKIISFDEEYVTKDTAKQLVQEVDVKQSYREEIRTTNVPQAEQQVTDKISNTKKKNRRKRAATQPSEPSKVETQEELDVKNPKINTEESIRAKKRRKHAQLKEEQKLESELQMQKNCLSYVSLWKHSRNEWKFVKMKQIWLMNNIFDEDKIPEEFFETTVDYFNGAKGNAREQVLKKALEIIKQKEEEENEEKDEEGEEKNEEEIEVEANEVKINRARTIIQNIQE